jgi:hypothetical protein
MATVVKDFKIKSGLIVEGTTAKVNNFDVLTKKQADQDYIIGLIGGTATSTNTANAVVKRDGSGNFAAGTITATLTGNVTGDLTGDVTGDVTGNVTGDLTGDVTGNVTGNVTGDVTGDLTGDVTGDVTGNVTGNLTGNVTGSVSGNAGTATALQTARTIAGQTFDGTQNVSIAPTDLTGVTATAAELNILDGATLSTSELNILDGATVTASELNILDGATLTTTELNYVDGVTSGIQGQLNDITADITALETSTALADHAADTSTHGVTEIVGASESQTLTNKTFGDDLLMDGNQISGLGTPTQADHAATKSYVDAVSEGLHIHESARAATNANVSIANGLENGDTLGGVTLATGDRVLVKNQTTASENGIYVVQASGQAVRAADFDTALEVDSGDFIFVTSGTYANTGWVQTLRPATIGTDPISFTQFSGAGTFLAGNGLELNGSTFEIDETITATRTFASSEADSAEQNAKDYADGLAVNYDESGAAAAVQTNLDNHENDTSTHGVTGAIVGTTDSQTLTNKTINTASNDITVVVADVSDLTASAAELNVLDGITASTVELNYVDGVTSAIQTQLDAKATPANITTAIDNLDTDDIEEGTSNLYYTTARAKTDAAALLVGATKTNITITGNGSGLTITAENGVADSTTTDLDEGTNLYFTDERAVDALQGTDSMFNTVSIDEVALQVAATLSAPTAGVQTAYAWAHDDYRSAEFLVKVAYGTHTEISKVLLTLDTSENIAITEYGIVGTNGSASTISAGISGTDVQLLVTTANNSSTVTVVGTLLA